MPASSRSSTIIEAEIHAVRAALGTGALSVEYEGRKVTYRSLSEMTRTIAQLERELAAATNVALPNRRKYAEFHRGYRTPPGDSGCD